MSTFTKGRWKLLISEYKYQIVKEDDEKAVIATIGTMKSSVISIAEREANAYLIKAAPRLLQALKDIRQYNIPDMKLDTVFIDAVISEAEGK